MIGAVFEMAEDAVEFGAVGALVGVIAAIDETAADNDIGVEDGVEQPMADFED